MFLIILMFVLVPVVHGLEITQVGVFDFGVAYDIVYRDDVAYVSGNDGVDVFDVSDRENPEKLVRIETSGGAFGLALEEDVLYVAAVNDGLLIVDVSSHGNPVTLGSVMEFTAMDVYVDGGYAYVSCGGSYSIVDVSNPRSPVISSTVSGSGRSYTINVNGDTLYLGETEKGLMVYDISDRSEPVYLRTVSGTIGIFDIKSDGAELYLACHGNGIKVLDISDGPNPRLIGGFNNGGEAYGIHIVDGFLLVADLQQGIKILDISEPTTPTLSASWTSTHPHGISGDSQYVYLADQDDGLEIFIYGEDIEAPETPINNIDASENDSIVDRVPFNASFVLAGILATAWITRKKL